MLKSNGQPAPWIEVPASNRQPRFVRWLGRCSTPNPVRFDVR